MDPTLPASEARYFRIYVDTDSHKPACINDVKIFGKVLVANSSSGGTSGSQ